MLSVIVGVLVVTIVFHLLLTFGLIARIRTLQEMVEGQSNRDLELPAAGAAIGAFAAVTSAGEAISDAELRDGAPTLVGFFTPNCKACEQEKAALLAQPPTLPLLAFVDGSPEDPEAVSLIAALGKIGRAAFTHEAAMTAFHNPTGFPTLYRIEQGAIAAAGHRVREVMP